MKLNKGFIFVLVLAALTALASWHASRHSRAADSERPDASSRLNKPEPGWIPPIDSTRWQCVVIHHSATEAGGAARFDRAHREKGWDELGYHFVIGNGSDTADGQVEVGPRWIEQKHGAHCYTPDEFFNAHGIGICVVGNLDNHAPSPAQEQSLERLVVFLCRRYNVPADRVYTHGQITGRTRCPGATFNLAKVRAAVDGV